MEHIPADSFGIRTGPYGCSIIFQYDAQKEGANIRQEAATIHMSPILMKVLAIKVRKAVKMQEERDGLIGIPPSVASNEGISIQEDW